MASLPVDALPHGYRLRWWSGGGGGLMWLISQNAVLHITQTLGKVSVLNTMINVSSSNLFWVADVC